jgi:hypothetical protein
MAKTKKAPFAIRKAFERVKQFFHNPSFKSQLLIFVIAMIFSVPLISELTQGHMYNSTDMNFHIQRFIGTRDAIIDGQIVPQLDPNVLDGFGSATNIFYGPLSAYINTVLNIIFKMNFVVSIPIFFIIFIFLAGISMYHLVKYTTKRESSAAISATAYLAMPFFILSAFQWQSFGTIIVFTLLPLAVLGFYKILDRKKLGVLLLSLSGAGLVLSHMLSLAIVLVFITILCIANWKKIFHKSVLQKLLLSLLFIFMITAFFILPFFAARNLDIYNIFDHDFLACFMYGNYMYVNENATPLVDLFYSTSGASIGIISILITVLAMFHYKKLDRNYNSRLLLIIGLIFALLSTKLIPWEHLPSQLWTIQFPFRLLIVSCFCFSAIAGDVIYKSLQGFSNKKVVETMSVVVIIILAFNVYQTSPNIRQMGGREHVPPVAVPLDPLPVTSGIAQAEYLPKQIIGMIEPTTKNLAERSKLPEFIKGSGSIEDFSKNGSHINFSIKTDGESTIELPIIFYQGYDITIDDQLVNNTWSESGYVMFTVPDKGSYGVNVRFAGSSLTKISTIISIFGAVGLIIFSVFERRLENLTKTSK